MMMQCAGARRVRPEWMALWPREAHSWPRSCAVGSDGESLAHTYHSTPDVRPPPSERRVLAALGATSAHAHDIPYFAFAWGRDDEKQSRSDVVIEERNPAEIRQALGVPTTIDAIDTRYPTFDITPPKYVSGVVTVNGVVSPCTLKNYKKW